MSNDSDGSSLWPSVTKVLFIDVQCNMPSEELINSEADH